MKLNTLDCFKNIGGANYRYQVEGDGDVVLVLLHGFTGTLHTWDAFVEKWKDHFTILRIDLPGHGKTFCQIPRTMKSFAHDLNIILDELHIEKCHVLGYSLGGRTALSFQQFYPEKVQTLLLESASPGLIDEVARKKRRLHDNVLADKIEIDGVEHFVDEWENIALFQTQKRLPKHVRQTIRNERLNQTEVGLADSLRHMGTGKQPSWWESLSQINIPVTLIVGALDAKFVQMNEQMDRLLQYSDLFVVEDAGHCVHVEQVEKFVKIVMEQLVK